MPSSRRTILLVKKSRGPYKNRWDLPGDRPDHGETILQTLKREIKEETGIELLDAVFHANCAFTIEYMDNNESISFHHICLIYKATKFDASHFKEAINHEDVQSCAWIKKSELNCTPLSNVALSILL
jgi:8-oxo-dGTP diphosphatase